MDKGGLRTDSDSLKRRNLCPKEDPYLVVEAASLAHGREARLLPTDVSEHLEDHETQEEKIEAQADPCDYNKGHLCRGS